MARGSTRARKQATADRTGIADPAAPLDGGELLTAARPVLSLLRSDLEERANDPVVAQALEARYDDEKKSKLTGDSFSAWREARIAQIAASWFLSCVFVRTLEDRGLLGQARLAGPGAMDSQAMFFQLAPSLTERDYLLFVFRELAELPASRALFDREHALVWQLSPSAESAKELLRLFRTPNAETPAFRFGQPSTRFLGDLYQDLYEDVRKRFALLQTPDFVESFILDRTLEPAIARFGLDDTTLIDPTCGSGHFLLGAFDRLFEHRMRKTPGIDIKQAAQRALDAVFGADINPYAVAIARTRLVLAFLEKAGIAKLRDAPAPKLHLVVADSLRYNPQHVQLAMEHHPSQDAKAWVGDAFPLEDDQAARDVLLHQYAAVVGNPPYITEKDPAKRETYRDMYPRSATGKYALSAPFCERFFQLARDRGYVGQITANSFMTREFGKGLIEQFLPSVNLEFVANTRDADIPGHTTPTLLLFGTNEPPGTRAITTILAKRGETSPPLDKSQGAVWRSVVDNFVHVGFENEYVSVVPTPRDRLAKHPWSLGGGGVLELKELLEERCSMRLEELVDDIGFASFTGLDDAFIISRSAAKTQRIESSVVRPMIVGENVRDWGAEADQVALAPYDSVTHDPLPLDRTTRWARFLWPYRTTANNVTSFGGKTRQQCGDNWWEWYRWQRERYAAPFRIVFAFVATHNHFVLDRGGRVFSRTAPIIRLPAAATEVDHLALIAYLNSSTACFWMKQVFYPKATATGDISLEKGKPEANRYEFAGTGLAPLPIPAWTAEQRTLLAELARECFELASVRESLSPRTLVCRVASGDIAHARDQETAEQERRRVEARLSTLQEDIDWLVYELFGLTDRFTRSASVHDASNRPFESPKAEFDEWTGRREVLAKSEILQLLETPVFKRLWSGRRGVFGHAVQTFSEGLHGEAREWVQAKAEVLVSESSVPLTRRQITRLLVQEDDVQRIAALLQQDAGRFVESALDAGDAVPFLASLRYTEQGLAKFHEWCRVWQEQRLEDEGGSGPAHVPPRYADKDFADARYWRLRGKLDVPKERFISYPGCESEQDGEPVYGWAGWNHLQRAQALAALYQKRKTEEAWTAERLTPMLAGLDELLPWINQWHNDLDPEYGLQMGNYFAQFLDGEISTLGLTKAQLDAWRPTKRVNRSKVAAVTGATSNAEATASSPRRPRRARQQANEPADTTSPEASTGVPPVRKHSSLPTWDSHIIAEVASRTGLGTKAGAWATNLRGESLGTAALAAVLRQQTQPNSREHVERAVVLALLPRLMQPHFTSASRWKSIVGKNDMGVDSVTSLEVPWKTVIRSAIQQQVLVEDADGNWSAGPDIDDVPVSALDARALVALSWIAIVPAEDAAVTRELEELRAAA